MSWFTSGLETLSQLSEKVQKAIPLDKDLLAKLTLNTDEMKAERQQFGEEAKRKEQAKDMLAGMLPWETRDKERDILVEECKEAILALSHKDETFYGPYEMPELKVKLDDNNNNDDDDDEAKKKATKIGEDGEEEEEDEVEEEVHDDEDGGEDKMNQKPSQESLEKLAKLEPLPPLLRDFDLDSHVGLIQKLLKVDPELQRQQSTLSGKQLPTPSVFALRMKTNLANPNRVAITTIMFVGGGDREKVFWHNYFFHCAYTRYEAGLSIDEIWSFQAQATQAANVDTSAHVEAETSAEEVVVFDDAESDKVSATDSPFVPDETTGAKPTDTVTGSAVSEGANLADTKERSPSGSATSDFEMLDDGEEDMGTSDPILDELEAEIARELED